MLPTTTSRIVLAVAAFLAVVLTAPSSASAHTDFDFSIPADGDVVEQPLTEITVAFTLPVTLIGDGFRVLAPSGEEVTPAVSTSDETVFVLAVEPAIAGGVVAVAWEVAAADGHPLSGAFTFTVEASTPSTSAAATTSPTMTTMPAAPTTAASGGTPSNGTSEPITGGDHDEMTDMSGGTPSNGTSEPITGGDYDGTTAGASSSPAIVEESARPVSSGGGVGSTGSHIDLALAVIVSLVMGLGAFVRLRPGTRA